MTISELLRDLRKRDIRLRVDGDKLRFRAPAGGMSDELKHEIAKRRAEIIQILRVPSQEATPGDRPPIRPIPRRDDLRLSYAQEQLWFLDQLEPNNPAYNVPEAALIGPGLDIGALQRGFETLVSRHENLRTNYAAPDGVPVLVIRESGGPQIDHLDLSGLRGSELDTEIRRITKEEARRPFDLARDPMLRVTLGKLPGGAHLLVLLTHHIACDGWSMAMLFRELAALYEGFANGREPKVPTLRAQYADYADWQRKQLKGPAREELVSFWTRWLNNPPRALELPTDHPRPQTQTFRGAKLDFDIPVELADGLDSVARNEGATNFMTLLAAFMTLLHRYTGEEDLCVGSPVAVYNRDELEPLIGLWLNVLVMRGDLSGSPSARDLIAQLRESTLDAFEHQDLPFHQLVEHLDLERDPARNPLFQVMFIQQLQNAPSRALASCGLDVTPLAIDNQTSKLDLTLSVAAEDERFVCWFEYNTDLFEPQTIARLRDHFLALAEGIAKHPERPVSQLPLITAEERRRYVEEWNATDTEWSRDLTVDRLFEAQAEKTPDARAVGGESGWLTYAELDQHANRVARHLLDKGVDSQQRVGICLERGPLMLVGLLGVLKSGAAYVPLDPEYPQERLSFMLSDAHVRLIVSEESVRGVLPADGCTVVSLDADAAAIAEQEAGKPATDGDPEQLAYVIYTSGSTGRPKGVQVPHRGVVNLLEAMAQEPGISASDTMLAVTTLSFDIAVLELLLPLIVGGRVVIADSATTAQANTLIELIASSAATIMQATPATWRMLFDAGWSGSPDLKALCGGEALPADLARLLCERTKEAWNLYGPTETTIWSTRSRLEDPESPVTIGRPIANTEVYLLDRHLEPVPVGVAGEVFIGGAGVARGYLDRPELTAERFVAHPFRDEPAARLYRTGDRGRFRPNGSIEFLGRSDDQVKLRGFRIELGEIESLMRKHEAIRDAVTVVRELGPGDQRLICFYVLKDGKPSPTGTELRAGLADRLPSYMVPNTFVELAELPLTPNGKIDRNALPEPDIYRLSGDAEFVAPQGAFQTTIAEIWQEALKVHEVGANDNFFDLGGHSLLAVRVISQIERRLNVELSVREIVLQSLGQLASFCEEAAGVATEAPTR